MRIKITLILTIFCAVAMASPSVTVVNSTSQNLQLHVSVNPNSNDDLKPLHVLIGLPNNQYPELHVNMLNKRELGGIADNINVAEVEWLQLQKLRGLYVATLKITPGSEIVNSNQYYGEMTISINFAGNRTANKSISNDKNLSLNVINWQIAKNWKHRIERQLGKIKDLPSGQWLKFEVQEDGMYQINGSDLLTQLPTIDQNDTRSFILYTGINLGRAQSQTPGSPIPTDNLTEITYRYSGSDDGTFSENDKIIFYGHGASGFDLNGTNISYNQNLYFKNNIYYLLIPDDNNLRSKRISELVNNDNPTINLDYGIHYQHIQTDLENPFQSGLGWVEQSIATNNSIDKSFDVINPSSGIAPILKVGLQGGTTDLKMRQFPNNKVDVKINSIQNNSLANITWYGLGQKSSTINLPDGSLNSGSNSFFLTNNSDDNYSNPYFDYMTLSYGRQLQYTDQPFEFYTPVHGNSTKFTIRSTTNPTIWNVSDAANPIALKPDQSGNEYSLIVSPATNLFERLIVFNSANISTITNIEILGNRVLNTLRNSITTARHIIIAPKEYQTIASRYTAHRDDSIFAPLETIYNEFSGGNTDPMALRNFIAWTQNNWNTPIPNSVFIIGDADYDYRNITGKSINIVPTIEVGITNSYASDDRLATINGRIPDVATGRFPARTDAEAENYIDKIIEFENNPEFGLWRQRVTLVADDPARPEDTISELNIGKSHTINSEILAEIIPSKFDVNKLYMLEFPEESDATSFGVAKPEATSTLFDILKKGTAIVNYIGHGSAHQWAQERLLFQDRGDLQSIETGMKLPLWIAGTCSWGHFDDIERESFSEELIRQPMNGAAAIITTSRPITVTSNQYYEEQIFNNIFPSNSVSDLPIGTILQSVKLGNQEGEYFHLFGDPAMKLVLPTNDLNITKVTPDTLRTLEESEYHAQQNISTNGGEGYIILKDANRSVTREYNYLSKTESLTYDLPGSTLFRGKFSFDDNNIFGKLRIPKDITISNKPASLKLYIMSNNSHPLEALGFTDSLFIKNGATSFDKFGPIINFETQNKRMLGSGDHILPDDEVFIRLTDPLGINLTGEIGHNIELINNFTDAREIITDDFIYDNNSITSGIIPLNLDEDVSAIHYSVKAWDSANNPAESEIKLNRIAKANLKLFNVTNFPNPFSKSTQFTFELSQSADVSISIFTIGGRKIMQFDSEYFPVGFNTIDWNGRDAFGGKLANGVYLYRLKAVSAEESTAFIGRLDKYE